MKKLIVDSSIILLILIGLILTVELLSHLFISITNNSQPKDVANVSDNKDFLNFLTEYKGTANIPYKSHIGWQSPEFHGKFINISKDGLRTTGHEHSHAHSRTVHFFGSSTMWGFGVPDSGTIPWLFSEITGLNSINYGELAWNSRQSLNRLIDNIDNIKKKDIVIFYDGPSDAIYGCYPNMVGSHAREQQIKNALEATSYDNYSITFGLLTIFRSSSIYKLYNNLLKRMNLMESKPIQESSCLDMATAQQVANYMENNWMAADLLTRSRGAVFYSVLQPSIVYGNKLDKPIPAHDDVSIKNVYQLTIKDSVNLKYFKNLSNIQIPNQYYIDYQGHTTKEGNRIIASMLADIALKPPNE